MPLEWQVIQHPFGAGIDQKTDQRQVPFGKLTSANNVEWGKNGQLRKRNGFAKVSANGGAYRLATFQNELNPMLRTAIYTYSPAESAMAFVDVLPDAVASWSFLQQQETELIGDSDLGVCGNYTAHAWLASDSLSSTGAIYYSLRDNATGAYLVNRVKIATGVSVGPRICVVGTTIIVIVAGNAGANTVQAGTIDTTSATPSLSVLSTLRTDFDHSNPVLDACAMSATFAIVYTPLAATHARIALYSAALSAGNVGDTDPTLLSLRAYAILGTTGEKLYVAAYYNNAGTYQVNAQVFDPASLSLTPAFNVRTLSASDTPGPIGFARVSSTQVLLSATYAHLITSVYVPVTFTQQIASTGANTGVQRDTGFIQGMSKPFTASGRVLQVVYYASSLQGTQYLVDLNSGDTVTADLKPRPICTIAPRQLPGAAMIAKGFQLCTAQLLSANKWISLGLNALAPSAGSAPPKSGLTLMQFDFASSNALQPVRLGDNLHLSAGTPTYYDGGQAAEVGFLWYPEGCVLTPTTDTGTMGLGTYQYVGVWEYWDNKGQLHRSAPSVATSVTLTGTQNEVLVQFNTLGLTSRQRVTGTTKIGLAVYRTTAGGTVFYRLTGTNTPFMSNDINGYLITLGDKTPDANITANQLLYTTGGVQPNVCPPSFSAMCTHKGRVWGVGDDGKTLWYSKVQTQGEAIAFADVQTYRLDEGGIVTALASMDDKLVAFKSDRIAVIYGEGPNDLGAGVDYQTQWLATDTGCIEPRSVVLTPQGLMFQAQAGLYLLSRGLEVSYAASAVEDTLDAYPAITGAVVHASKNQVRFSCTNASGSAGAVLVLDYVQNAWSTFGLGDGVSATTAPPISSTMYAGNWVWLGSNAGVYIESSALYRDAGQWITSSFETSWVQLAGLQGFQRIKRVMLLGDKQDPCDLTVSVATDYAPSYSQSKTWDALSVNSLTRSQVEEHVMPGSQKCESMRVKVVDASPTTAAATTYQGWFFTGIAFEVGVKRTPYRSLATTAKG